MIDTLLKNTTEVYDAVYIRDGQKHHPVNTMMKVMINWGMEVFLCGNYFSIVIKILSLSAQFTQKEKQGGGVSVETTLVLNTDESWTLSGAPAISSSDTEYKIEPQRCVIDFDKKTVLVDFENNIGFKK